MPKIEDVEENKDVEEVPESSATANDEGSQEQTQLSVESSDHSAVVATPNASVASPTPTQHANDGSPNAQEAEVLSPSREEPQAGTEAPSSPSVVVLSPPQAAAMPGVASAPTVTQTPKKILVAPRRYRFANTDDRVDADAEPVDWFAANIQEPLPPDHWHGVPPGMEFWSSRMEKPVFHPSSKKLLNPKNKPTWTRLDTPPYPEIDQRYHDHYERFFNEDVGEIPEDRESAYIGRNCIRVSDIKTLSPQGWLNDTIINSYAKVIGHNNHIGEPSGPKVAVFDSMFVFTLLNINVGPESRSLYNYENSRGHAARALRDKSPMDYDVLLFMCNVQHDHWQLITVYPHHKWIEPMDPLRQSAEFWGRLIFRWLYDEIHYNRHKYKGTIFSENQPDYGWYFNMETTSYHVQRDGYNCGIYVLGFVLCIIQRMNPLRLDEKWAKLFRIKIFCELCPVTIRVDDTRAISIPIAEEDTKRPGKPGPLPKLPPDTRRTSKKRSALRIEADSDEEDLEPSHLYSEKGSRTLPSSRSELTPEEIAKENERRKQLTLAQEKAAKRYRDEQKKKREAKRAKENKQYFDREARRKVAKEKAEKIWKSGLRKLMMRKGKSVPKQRENLINRIKDWGVVEEEEEEESPNEGVAAAAAAVAQPDDETVEGDGDQPAANVDDEDDRKMPARPRGRQKRPPRSEREGQERTMSEMEQRGPVPQNLAPFYASEVAYLMFVPGYSTIDPPSERLRNYFCKFKADGKTKLDMWKFNHFRGMSGDKEEYDMQLAPKWVDSVFSEVFTEVVRMGPNQWFHVPIGSSDVDREAPAVLKTSIGLSCVQGGKDHCLSYAIASSMRYIGLREESLLLTKNASMLKHLPGDLALEKAVGYVQEAAPQIGMYTVYNGITKKQKKAKRLMELDDLLSKQSPFITIVEPIGRDGSRDHVVAVVDDIVFDTRVPVALQLCKETFDWICGEQGISKLGRVYQFVESMDKKKKFPKREMQKNW